MKKYELTPELRLQLSYLLEAFRRSNRYESIDWILAKILNKGKIEPNMWTSINLSKVWSQQNMTKQITDQNFFL